MCEPTAASSERRRNAGRKPIGCRVISLRSPRPRRPERSARHRHRRTARRRTAARVGPVVRPRRRSALGIGALAHGGNGRSSAARTSRRGVRRLRARAHGGRGAAGAPRPAAPLGVHRRDRGEMDPARVLDGRFPAPRLARRLRGVVAAAADLRAPSRLQTGNSLRSRVVRLPGPPPVSSWTNVSLTLRPERWLAIVARTAQEKTTLVKSSRRLRAVHQGRFCIDDTPSHGCRRLNGDRDSPAPPGFFSVSEFLARQTVA